MMRVMMIIEMSRQVNEDVSRDMTGSAPIYTLFIVSGCH